MNDDEGGDALQDTGKRVFDQRFGVNVKGRERIVEDEDLWPALRRHLETTEDQGEVDRMIDEHRDLLAAIEAVDLALDEGGNPDQGLAGLGHALRDHLDHEERRVLPLLQHHMSRAEWQAFLRTERRRTPLRDRPDFLGWVLDEASPQDTNAVLSELPPPGRLVSQHMILPRYQARHAS